jgi:anti-sigma factor RsiW
MNPTPSITEAELQAHVDGLLTPERQRAVEAHLSQHPEEAQRLDSYRAQKRALRALFDPVLDEAMPTRLWQAARPRTPWYLQRLAAGVVIALVSGASAWMARGVVDGEAVRLAALRSSAVVTASNAGASGLQLAGFARRAAVAHVVYSPDVRRPVEIGVDQEQQLVAWLSKRLGISLKPPSLHAIGYELIGGRLLPGDSGPVAQLMYHDALGQRLTLYVTREAQTPASAPSTAFQFGQDGPVNVFYWVDQSLGYAISGGADKGELLRVAQEVHRQLMPG